MESIISGIGRMIKLFTSWTAPHDAGLNLTGAQKKAYAHVQKRGL